MDKKLYVGTVNNTHDTNIKIKWKFKPFELK